MSTQDHKTQHKDKFLSPLRYPGSKRRLASFVLSALRLNDFRPKLYIEPFIGGANVGLKLLVEDCVDKVIFIDVDPMVAYFWEAVFFDTAWLVDQITSIEVTLNKWKEIKELVPISKRDYALKCLFLNRTNFSGILRNEVGPLGGKNQTSEYKIDCRFPRETLVNRVERLSQLKSKVAGIWNCSWIEGLMKLRKMQNDMKLTQNDVFLYFDPPFFEKAESLYRFYFNEGDHVELRDYLLSLEDSWILSYDASPLFFNLYDTAIKNGTNGTKKKDIELVYSTGVMLGRKPTKEVIVSNLRALPNETKLWKTATGT